MANKRLKIVGRMVDPDGNELIDSSGNFVGDLEVESGDAIVDSSGNEMLEFTVTASAVNHVGISNTGTGVSPVFIAEGEANTGFNFVNSEAEEVLILDSIATSVNELTISSAATGSGPILAATGDDTNVDVNINPKGTGSIISTSTEAGVTGAGLVLYQNSASPAVMDSVGVITFRGKDDGGNVTDYVTLSGMLADPTGGAELGAFAIGGQDQSGSASNWLAVLREGTEVLISAVNAGDDLKIDTDSSGDIYLIPGGSSSVILSGGVVFSDITSSSGAGAVAITSGVHEVTTTGTGDALTLANGTAGQRLCVVYVAEGAGGDTAVITPTTFAGGSTITLNDLGDSCDLVYSSTGGWYVLGLGGAAAVA